MRSELSRDRLVTEIIICEERVRERPAHFNDKDLINGGYSGLKTNYTWKLFPAPTVACRVQRIMEEKKV